MSNLITDESDDIDPEELDQIINKNFQESDNEMVYTENLNIEKVVDGHTIYVDREKLGRWGKYVLEWTLKPEDRIGLYSNGTYFKFIFVRHPLERILSGYRDKVQRYFLNRPLFYGLREQMFKEGKEAEYKELDVHGFQAFLRYLRGTRVFGILRRT